MTPEGHRLPAGAGSPGLCGRPSRRRVCAPAENIQSFLEGRGRLNIGRVQPTYDRGVVAADLGALLPTELADTLRAGLRAYERKIAGYTAPRPF